MTKRMRSTMFDAVQILESQDTQAEKQQKRIKNDIQRSKAAQSQTKIYSSLLECRILLQRAITQKQQHQKQEKQTSPKQHDMNDCLTNCNNLLVNLLEARRMLTQKKDDKSIDYENIVQKSKQLDDVLASEYETCRKEWKETFNRRHRDVRLHSGQLTAKSSQFRVVDSSFWEQVEANVQHEQQRQKQQRNQKLQNNTDDDKLEENGWQFDDSKVYQQLLKDFVTTASSQTGREEAVAAQERLLKKQQRKNGGSSSAQKQVDRRASKGRKLRYTEFPKLLNFTFPMGRPHIPEASGSNLDEDEWFMSLFGGTRSWKK